jgi:hypothetical protein
MPIDDYNISEPDYKPGEVKGTITRTVNYLVNELGIHSREDLMKKFDDHATAGQLIGLEGIGPEIADDIVWLRGKSITGWRELTGLPAFNDPKEEAASKAISPVEGGDDDSDTEGDLADGSLTLPPASADMAEPPSSADQDWS